MKKLLVFLIIVYSSVLFGQSAGNAGMAFLRIGDAKSISTSDLGVVGNYDLRSVNYNPAVLYKYENPEFMFSHNEWIQDTRTELFYGSVEALGLPFAFGVNTTSISDIEVRNRPGEVQSTFDVSYFYASVSTGFTIMENLAVGTTIKYLYESFWRDDATGYAYDFGVIYSGLIEKFDLGFSMRNLGSMKSLRDQETNLPADMRLGASYNYQLASLEADVNLIAGYQKYTDFDEGHVHFGGEFLYKELFAVRLGYMSGYETKNITAGFGLNYGNLTFDYAYMPMDYDLGDTHTLTFKYSFKNL